MHSRPSSTRPLPTAPRRVTGHARAAALFPRSGPGAYLLVNRKEWSAVRKSAGSAGTRLSIVAETTISR